jgi:hypothetical protein
VDIESFGQMKTFDLKPNGGAIMVTKDDREGKLLFTTGTRIDMFDFILIYFFFFIRICQPLCGLSFEQFCRKAIYRLPIGIQFNLSRLCYQGKKKKNTMGDIVYIILKLMMCYDRSFDLKKLNNSFVVARIWIFMPWKSQQFMMVDGTKILQ